MYKTTSGIRSRIGAEERLFLESLGIVMLMLEDEQAEFGIPLFDALPHSSKLAALFDASRALLEKHRPLARRAAYIDAAFAAVHECTYSLIRMEVEESLNVHSSQYWRSLARNAALQAGIDCPAAANLDLLDWCLVKENLVLNVVHEDFASEFCMDMDPYLASAIKQSVGLPDDYFIKIPDDPPAERVEAYKRMLFHFGAMA